MGRGLPAFSGFLPWLSQRGGDASERAAGGVWLLSQPLQQAEEEWRNNLDEMHIACVLLVRAQAELSPELSSLQS